MITQIEIKTPKLELSYLFYMYNIYIETNISVYTKTILNVKLYWKEHCYVGKFQTDYCTQVYPLIMSS